MTHSTVKNQWHTEPEISFTALLQTLVALHADERPLVIWLGPEWVVQLISPYVRDTKPLLQEWCNAQPELAILSKQLEQNNEDAAYLCADLFTQAYPEVQYEKEQAEAQCGLFTIRNVEGELVFTVADPLLAEPATFDSRLGVFLQDPNQLPLVVLCHDRSTSCALYFRRLLLDVEAKYPWVVVSTTATETSDPMLAPIASILAEAIFKNELAKEKILYRTWEHTEEEPNRWTQRQSEIPDVLEIWKTIWKLGIPSLPASPKKVPPKRHWIRP